VANYATVTELDEFLGHTPDGAERMLTRATRRVRSALMSARYDPTNQTIIDALREATLELCAWWDDNGMDGSESGPDADPGTWTSVSAGSIAFGRGSGGSGAGGSSESATARTATRAGLPEQAYLVLQQAGLTGHGPRTGYVGRW
jgi:hypothetical protein